jgi:hypothetical protein
LVQISSSAPFLKYPQDMLLLYCQRPSFTTIQNHRQKYRLVYSNF